LHFDGSTVGGAGIVIVYPTSKTIQLSYKLDFGCPNNEAEYEALIVGLLAVSAMGITSLNVKGDSRLILNQVKGEYGVKELALALYRTIAHALEGRFKKILYNHTLRSSNRHADALAILASKVDVGLNGEE
ncbi:RVT_3 domain-containing protein, partial [Cephalotus follicularis]